MTYPAVSPAQRAANGRRIADRFARMTVAPDQFTNLPCCGWRMDTTRPIPPSIDCPGCGSTWIDLRRRHGAIEGRLA